MNISAAITYQLTIQLSSAARIEIGKLGIFDFPAGRYIYTGSAKRNLEARIARHLRQDKILRWHIDYLLAAPEVVMVGVERFSQAECELNQQTSGQVLIAGFGASDCRNGCGSHLKLIGEY